MVRRDGGQTYLDYTNNYSILPSILPSSDKMPEDGIVSLKDAVT